MTTCSSSFLKIAFVIFESKLVPGHLTDSHFTDNHLVDKHSEKNNFWSTQLKPCQLVDSPLSICCRHCRVEQMSVGQMFFGEKTGSHQRHLNYFVVLKSRSLIGGNELKIFIDFVQFYGATTFGTTTFNSTTFSTTTLNVTTLGAEFFNAESHLAKRRCAMCRYAMCRYAKCRYVNRRHANSHGAKFTSLRGRCDATP